MLPRLPLRRLDFLHRRAVLVAHDEDGEAGGAIEVTRQARRMSSSARRAGRSGEQRLDHCGWFVREHEVRGGTAGPDGEGASGVAAQDGRLAGRRGIAEF